ncbi:MAG: hypothetical protein MRK01_17300 [Candidatus Scalindua sp.]|nr:hypothetical protein [Candidatus Scalindua sp.]
MKLLIAIFHAIIKPNHLSASCPLQILRYSSRIGFQWIMFFIIPEFLFQLAVEYKMQALREKK